MDISATFPSTRFQPVGLKDAGHHLPRAMAGDEVKALTQLRDRLCLLSGAESRRLKHDAVTWPGAKHPHGQTSDSAASCPKKIAYTTNAFESVHVPCGNIQEVEAHQTLQ